MTGELIYSSYTYNQGRVAINNAFSGEASFNIFSADTIYSGSTNLYDIFGSGDVTRIQPGTNVYTGGTENYPTINISSATLNSLTISGSSNFGSVNIGSVGSGSAVATLGVDSSGNVVSATTTDTAFVSLVDGYVINWGYDISPNATVILAGNRVLYVTGMTDGASGTLLVIQDGTGERTLTLSGGTHKVVNGGGGSIALSSGGNDEDILTFIYTNSTFYWNIGYDYN